MTVFHSAMLSFLAFCKETCLFSFGPEQQQVFLIFACLNATHHFLQFVHGSCLQLRQCGGQLISLSLLLWWNDPENGQ